jgi:acetyltransferase-like isoleucine patch superfamily enzyme
MYQNKYNSLAWIRGQEKGNVFIGEDCWIGPFTVIDGEYDKVELGKGVNVSSGAQIVTHDTVKRCLTGRIFNQIEHAPTLIENNVYIGTQAVILMGCVIGHHSIIAAGAVVRARTKIPPYSLVVGVPAVVKRNIQSEYEDWLNDAVNLNENVHTL